MIRRNLFNLYLTRTAGMLLLMLLTAQTAWADEVTASDVVELSNAFNMDYVDVITLEGNITGASGELCVTKDVTINLKGYSISGNYCSMWIDGATVTINGSGSINGIIFNYGTLNITSGVTLTGGIDGNGTVNYSDNIKASVTTKVTYNESEVDQTIYYSNFNPAVGKANEATNDVTVTLLGDVTLGESISFTNTRTVMEGSETRPLMTTLDLNGHTLTSFKENGDYVIMVGDGNVSNPTSVTITDYSKSVGKVVNTATNDGFAIRNSGELHTNNIVINAASGYAIQNYGELHTNNIVINAFKGIDNYGVATIGEGVSIPDYGQYGYGICNSNSGTLTIKALPTFTDSGAADIRLGEGKVIDFSDAETPLALALGQSKISVTIDNLDGSSPVAFTKGYKAAFFDETSGSFAEAKDVFTVSGGTVNMVMGEAVAVASGKELSVVTTGADGSIQYLGANEAGTSAGTGNNFADALYYATDGSTVTLMKDINMTFLLYNFTKGTAEAPVTIDLGDYTISGSVDSPLLTIGNGAHVIISGTEGKAGIKNTYDEGYALYNYGGVLNISGVAVSGSTGIKNNGTLTLSGGSISGYQNAGIYVDNGTVTLAGVPTFTPAEGSSAPDFALGIDKTTNSETGEDEYTLRGKIAFSTEGVDVSALTSKLRVMPADNDQKCMALPVPLQFTTGFGKVTKSGVKELLTCDVFEAVVAEGSHVGIGEMGNEAYFAPYAVETVSLPAGWSTWYDDRYFSVENAPEGITAYALTKVEGTDITVTALPEGKINSYLPILLYNGTGASVDVEMITITDTYFAREYSRSLVSALGDGPFYDYSIRGTNAGKTLSANDEYIYYGCNGEAFVPLDLPATVAAHRCWLEIPVTASARTRTLTIVFDDGDTTGIQTPPLTPPLEGRGAAAHSDARYNLQGQRVADTYRGIVIQNGKKYLAR